MSVNAGTEDPRRVKTGRALDMAMAVLLGTRNLRKITVKDLCDEALVSRAAFYASFTDKYDFLRTWLLYLLPKSISRNDPYEKTEKAINQFTHKNRTIIKNLICSADDETLGILSDVILSTLDLTIEREENGKVSTKYIVLSNFYVGGLLNYIQWQAKNKFPSSVMPMNIYLYEVIERFQELKN